MLHKQGDTVAFRVNSVEEDAAEFSGILVGVIKHTDAGGHYIMANAGTICCDHYVADWELMHVQQTANQV